jgi:hypothetical protein
MASFLEKQHASRPVKYQNLAYTGSGSVPSTNFGPSVQHIRVESDISGYLVIGDGTSVSATAQSSSMRIAANVEGEYFSCTPGQMAAFVSTSTSSGNCSIVEMG